MIDTSNKEIQSHYDYIVVGAGAAGSVLAAELSASGAQVLVIESGGPDDAPTIMNPSIWFYNVGGVLDYHLPITPLPQLNNRNLNMPLGHVLGGGSSIAPLRWSKEASISFMDDAGIDVAVVSLSTPGVHRGDSAKARRLARRCNEFSAELVHTRPGCRPCAGTARRDDSDVVRVPNPAAVSSPFGWRRYVRHSS